MRHLFVVCWTGMAVGLLAQAVLASDDKSPQAFQFAFEKDQPMVFAVDSKVKSLTDSTVQLDTGSKSSRSTNSVETRYKVKLTPIRKSEDGTWTLHYQPIDLEQDMRVEGGAGHVDTSIRGLEVKSSQNGIVIADTAKGIGGMQAKAIKQGFYPKMLSGYFDFKPNGEISKVDGDLPFIDIWTNALKYQVGFFDLEFPAQPVPPGGTWSKNITLMSLEGLKLGEEGIMETNVFVRNTASSANHLSSIRVSMMVNVRDITGSTDSMGQKSMLNIPQFIHTKSGSFEFDPDNGRLAKGSEDESVKATLDMLVQGHTVTTIMDMTTSTTFELLKN